MSDLSRKDRGYSLIEVLICLALTALVSTLIFSSLGVQVRQVDTVKSAQARALDGTASARLLETVLTKTVEAWPDDVEEKFSGSSKEVRGLSDHSTVSASSRLQPFVLRITQSADESILSLQNDEGEWYVNGLPADLSIRYLGWDDEWHDRWPPAPRMSVTLDEFETNLANESLPRMVAIVENDETTSLFFAFTLRNSGIEPVRARDLISQ